MAAPQVDVSLFPILVEGPFGTKKDAPHIRDLAMQHALCDALTKAFPTKPSQRFATGRTVKNKAFRKADLNLYWDNDANDVVTSLRARLNGVVKRAGVEYIGVSVVALVGTRVAAWSEDLRTSLSKCGTLLLADANEEVAPIDEAVRAKVVAKKEPAKEPAKVVAEKEPAKPATKPAKAKKAAPAQHRFIADAPIRRVAISPDGTTIAATLESQHVIAWDAATGLPRWSKRAGGNGMIFTRALAFSPCSQRLYSGSSSVKVFDVATGEEGEGLAGHPKGELVFIDTSDAGVLTTSGISVLKRDNSFALWDASGALKGQWKWELPERAVFIAGEPNAIFVSGYRDSRTQAVLCRFDLKRGAVIAEQAIASSFFVCTKKGIWVFDDETSEARLLDLTTLAPKATISLEGARLHAADEKSLYTSSGDEVQRRDFKGAVIASWNLPALEGAESVIGAIQSSTYRSVRPSDLHEVHDACVAADGSLVVATALTVQRWSKDGKPLAMPQVAC